MSNNLQDRWVTREDERRQPNTIRIIITPLVHGKKGYVLGCTEDQIFLVFYPDIKSRLHAFRKGARQIRRESYSDFLRKVVDMMLHFQHAPVGIPLIPNLQFNNDFKIAD